MGTRKRPRVCCLAIDLWRIIKIYSEKHVFDGTPLYSSAYSVVKVLFSLFWCVGSGTGTKRRVLIEGEKGSQKVCSNSIKNNCPKKNILLTFYQPKHRSIRSNLSNTNNTKLLHHVVFSLVFAKGKNFSLFSLASRERRELDF